LNTLWMMSWIIGVANPLSAALVGPILIVLSKKFNWSDRIAITGEIIGWIIVFAAQLTFMIFGFKSDMPGFKYAQPCMILVAAVNLWLKLYVLRPKVAVQDA
jgi:hypothetical protein